MKPKTDIAMRQLINEARAAIPFDMSEAQICSGGCRGCSRKLLAYLETELDTWDSRLDRGHLPVLGEIQSLAKTCHRIHRALTKSLLI